MKAWMGLLLVGWSAIAGAVTPAGGWWWNAAQSGRGYTIEVQKGSLFFIGYLYNADGSATWYVAQGPYSDSASRFTAPLLSFSGGPCITCPYSAPTQGPSPGNLTLDFSSPTTATLTWPGGSFPISRFYFGIPNDASRLLGIWVYSALGLTSEFTFWLTFDGTLTDPTLGLVATGETSSGRLAIGAYANGGAEIRVLVDSSSSFYQLWRFPTSFFDSNNGYGLWWLYQKGSSPTGDGRLGLTVVAAPASTEAAAPQGAVDKQARIAALVEGMKAIDGLEPLDLDALKNARPH
jgi:hypothetical protein